ncbi:hypothetical protein GQ600_23164 [Phytophthora cactorum]|nr:hypothetical protein GQ600_23164 [Phytophthora cactorum]
MPIKRRFVRKIPVALAPDVAIALPTILDSICVLLRRWAMGILLRKALRKEASSLLIGVLSLTVACDGASYTLLFKNPVQVYEAGTSAPSLSCLAMNRKNRGTHVERKRKASRQVVDVSGTKAYEQGSVHQCRVLWWHRPFRESFVQCQLPV